MTHTRLPECLWRSLKVSSAMPDLSRSPRPSAIMRSYCSLVARASGRSRPRLRASSSAMPLSLAACAAEKKQLCSRFCMSSPSVSSTREFAPVCEKTSRSIVRSRPSAAPSAKTFGEPGGVDVHDHVDQRFHFGGFACFADEANLGGKLFQNRFGFSERVFVSAAHQVELAFARLRNARRHACFERLRTGFVGQLFDLDMHFRRDRGAVDEQFAARVDEQIVTGSGKDLPHRVVVRHHGEDHVGCCRDFRQILRGGAPKLRREFCGGSAICVVNRRDVKTAVLQPARHVRAHSTDSDESDIHDLNDE